MIGNTFDLANLPDAYLAGFTLLPPAQWRLSARGARRAPPVETKQIEAVRDFVREFLRLHKSEAFGDETVTAKARVYDLFAPEKLPGGRRVWDADALDRLAADALAGDAGACLAAREAFDLCVRESLPVPPAIAGIIKGGPNAKQTGHAPRRRAMYFAVNIGLHMGLPLIGDRENPDSVSACSVTRDELAGIGYHRTTQAVWRNWRAEDAITLAGVRPGSDAGKRMGLSATGVR